MLVEAPRHTREARYLAAIDALTRKRDRAVDAHVRALYRTLGALRARLRDGLADQPVQDGHLRSDALAPARALSDALAGDLGRRLLALLTAGTQTMTEHGALFLPAALFTIGIGRNQPPKLREAADPLPGEEMTFAFPLVMSETQLAAARALTGEYVTAVTDDFRARMRQAILRNVAGQASLADLFVEVRGLLATQPDRRTGRLGTLTAQSERIVRTELLTAFSVASAVRDGELLAVVPTIKKTWRSAQDNRVRDHHRTADVRYSPGGTPGPIPMAQPFIVGGERMMGPRLGGSAANRINCRCIAPAWDAAWFAEGQ